ncbi:MAG TPA: dTDP-glucose 4,6-dehydratase [Humidesulfovibrio sp.]|uniref:dTDP-glucose 4,6-dehydratase n=1 Tax=Humidesulfovibrio sp. TaxID=2910988 RepID=UPI002CABE1E2|nr:dTDP-glucose 4,6-dehydratase [Humidesulfovibrio sp.]HWR04974.1 dTDP-glucose 4,6-dehydratase [Humidesulfovibrio sp.]
MRLLVTGGCGFIGANFLYAMRQRHPDWRIVNLDKLTYAGNLGSLRGLESEAGDAYTFIHGDICDRELVSTLLEEHTIDAVVNFAAESHVDRSIDDPAPFVVTNVLGAQNILDCARRAKIKRVVHVSTDEVYGSLGPTGQFHETTPLAPNSPYSASKAGADMLARAYHETYGQDVVVTRCSNNYGPFQFPEKLIPLMYTKAIKGEPLPVYGDGQNVRDWIFVDDHCRGVELALLKGRAGAVYNFGGAAEMPNLDVVRTILRLTGQNDTLIRFVTDRPGHDRRYAMNFDLAARELGFAPSVSFAEGMARTIAWYQANSVWLDEVQSGAYLKFMDRWYKERT